LTGAAERIERQLRFIAEIDKLKCIMRRTPLTDASRRENSAEHSWHMAIMAVLLREYAEDGVDVDRVMRLILVHDLVEIDAGDTFAYDVAANEGKAEREERAAKRLFNLLPADQAAEVRALWDEFEDGASREARYAVALDRLQPFIQNAHAGGGTWREHGVTRPQVLARMRPIETDLPAFWPFVVRTLKDAVERGWLGDDA
jgi:putative hydrolase of HD superfamily